MEDRGLTALGEYRDRARERAFRDTQHPLVVGQARLVAFVSGIAYLSGGVPYALAFGSTPGYHLTNVGRVVVFVATMLLALHPRIWRDPRTMERASVVAGVLAALGLPPMFILTPMGPYANAMLSLAVMIVVALFMNVPVRWAIGVVALTAIETVVVNHLLLHASLQDSGMVAIVVVPVALMAIIAACRHGAAQRDLRESLSAAAEASVARRREAEDRAQAERTVVAREQALMALVEHAPVPFVITDRATRRTLAANAVWRRLLELPDRGGDLDHPKLLRPEQLEQLEALLATEGAVRDHEVVLTTATGRTVYCRVSSVVSELGGRPCVVSSILDVTPQREYTRELEGARRSAEAANRAKSEFLAHMSHEIRTPMNGVLGMADVLLHTGLTPEQLDIVGTIRSSGTLLLTVINGILDLSKVESSTFELEACAFDPVEVLERSFEPLVVRAAEKGVRCDLRFGARMPRQLVGDEVRVQQVFMNLLGNAIKFTEVGAVRVDVEVTPRDAAWTLSISVTDTGIGISPDAAGALFAPFKQADASTTRRYGGTGLGLYITQQIARRMGGDVVLARSEPGEGSTFVATLELGAAAAEEARRGRLWVDGAPSLVPLVPVLRSLGYELVDRPAQDRDATGVVDAASPPAQLGSQGLWLRAEGDVPAPPGWAEVAWPGRRRALEAALERLTQVPLTRAPVPGVRELGRPMHVLVADDNAVNQKVLTHVLSQLGVTTTVVGDGVEALEALRGSRFDLVLMDMQMPGVDGVEATRCWRAEETSGQRMPIVAVTAHAMAEHRAQAIAAGMDDLITKPVSRDAVSAALARWAVPERGAVVVSAPARPSASW